MAGGPHGGLGAPEGGERSEGGRGPERPRPRRPAIYSVLVGLVFVAIVAVAGVNTLRTEDSGVLGAGGEGDLPLAQFAVPDARGELEGDANIAQDDCEVSEVPCPEDERRDPACEIDVPGAIRVCDLFGRPLVLSFWFTRGGECESQQDAFEAAYRRYGDRVGFLGINVRDERDDVGRLIAERGWTHPIGLDPDGALSNLLRVGGCPTFVYAYPGGIIEGTSVGELDAAELGERVEKLIARSREREARLR
ncbi:MAG: TlpA family protein disulfide reductase [Solirubrobacterales bacterium]